MPDVQAPPLPAGYSLDSGPPPLPTGYTLDNGQDKPGFLSDVGDTLKQYWDKVNPVTQAQGVANLATTDPRKTVRGYGDTNSRLYEAAKDSFKKGEYSEGVRHSLSYFLNGIPGLGTALDEAGNKAGAGDYKGAIADTAALATQIAAAKAVPAITDAATEPGAMGNAARSVADTAKTGAKATVAAAKAGGKDLAMGAAKTATGAALVKYGPSEMGDVLTGVPIVKSGLRQMAQGARNAYAALKQPVDLQAPPSVEATAPEPSMPSPFIAGGRTQDPSAVATPPPMQGPSLPPERMPPVQTGTVQVPPTLAPRADLQSPPSVESAMGQAPQVPIPAPATNVAPPIPPGTIPADPSLIHTPGDAVIPGNGREQIYSDIGKNLGAKIADAAAAKDVAAAEYLRNNQGITGQQFLNATPAERDAWLKIERHPTNPGKARYGGFSSTAAPGTPEYAARLQRFAQLLDAQPPPAGGPVVPQLPGIAQPGVPPSVEQAAPVAQPVPAPLVTPPVQPIAEGNTATVYTPNETKADVQYQLVNANQLRTSFMPGSDPELQPRSTDRLGSRQRIEELKGTMNPEKMGDSVNAGDGAPIMLPDGQLLTRNHGAQALGELYASGSPNAATYKAWLQNNARRFGIDPADVANDPQPVLVRKLLTPGSKSDLARFAEEANMSTTARMSDAEQAQMLAKRITGPAMEAFNPNEDGTPNPEFVQALLTDLPPQERAAFMDSKGNLSQSGLRNIRNAVFAKAYPDTSAIERMAESTDSNVRNISNGMLAAAPRFAQLQDAVSRGDRFDLGIAQDAARAAEVLDSIKDQGITPQQWLSQENLFGRDPVVDKLVETFAENRRSPKRIGDVLKAYADIVDRLGSPKQAGLFGAEEPPHRAELLEAANEIVKGRNAVDAQAGKAGELFAQGAPPRGGAAGGIGNQAGSQIAAPGQPQNSVGNTEPGMPPSVEIPRNPFR